MGFGCTASMTVFTLQMRRPNFDVVKFCRKLRNSKHPPYKCPIFKCGKIYKSLCGLQYHLLKTDHNAPESVSPVITMKPIRKKECGPVTMQPQLSTMEQQTHEGLTYSQTQKMVEFNLDGKMVQVSIYEELEVVSSSRQYEDSIHTGKNRMDGADQTPSGSEDVKLLLPEPCFRILESYNIRDAPPLPNSYIRFIERSIEELDAEIEYDMDEEDSAWLKLINERREAIGLTDVSVDVFELLMDRLEKESYFQMQISNKTEEATATFVDDDAVCCICMDGECQNSNVILFCDMCNLAVHQDCYGVPYIPEGQWLCRRCLQSPSRAVDCVLCPNNGGAFKQTDRGHWAHVVCALWIPEVRFANTVFLEPIDSIETIPPARWKLTCYICKQRGVGACIQCHKTNCYAAFHVTCAQHAGLYMKMDTVRDTHSGLSKETGPVLVQKTAFCDAHTPADADSRPRVATANKHQQLLTNSSHNPLETDFTREDLRQKMKKARRILAKKRSTLPIISIPTIPPERIQEIASLVNIPKKSQFIQRLIAYWTLKRQFRNGVPLLRRLQSSHLSRRDESQPQQEVGDLYRQLKYWQCLRQDLERARLLCELVRKREKLKNEMLKIEQRALELKITPFTTFLRHLWKLIEAKDISDIFLEPVDQNEVLDYADVVKHPMDLSTMRIKLENNKYSKLAEFEDDFNLMINNCLTYNSKDTVFYKSAIRMRDQCSELFRQARSDFATTHFNVDTGVLLPLNSTFYGENESLKKDTATSSFTIHAQQFDKLPLSDSHIINDINKKFLNILKAGRGKPNAERSTKLKALLQSLNELCSSTNVEKTKKAIKNELFRINNIISLGLTISCKGSEEFDNIGQDTDKEDTEHEETTDDENKKMENLKTRRKVSHISANRRFTRSFTEVAVAKKIAENKTLSLDVEPVIMLKENLKLSDHVTENQESILMGKGANRCPPNNSQVNSRQTSKIIEINKDSPSLLCAGRRSHRKKIIKNKSSCESSSQSQETQIHVYSELSNKESCLTDVTSSSPELNLGKILATTASPTGVNRRTAVLFTRKAAAAFKRPEAVDTPITMSRSSLASIASTVNRRRVGRPRKCLTDSSFSSPSLLQKFKPNSLILNAEQNASVLMPAPILPSSDSFTTYRTGGDMPTETDEETQSESSCFSCSSSDNSSSCSGGNSSLDLARNSQEESSADDDNAIVRYISEHLEPLTLVWAKCRGYPWYPALIINPKMPRIGYLHNGVPIPAPPLDVLALADNYTDPVYLVLFFDTKRTWQWLPHNKLELLGISLEVDQAKLIESRKPTDRKAVRKAYQEAMVHRCQVAGTPIVGAVTRHGKLTSMFKLPQTFSEDT